jgi:hypothetical protein
VWAEPGQAKSHIVAQSQPASAQPWPIAVYLIILSAITLVSVWLAAETHRAKLGERDVIT